MKNRSPQSIPFQLRPATPRLPQIGPAGLPYRGVDILDPFHHTKPVLRAAPAAPSVPAEETPQKTADQIRHLYNVGVTSAAMSFHESALETLQEVTKLAPGHAGAWRELANLLRLAARDEEADKADGHADALAGAPPPWPEAEAERSHPQLERLDRKLRARLEKMPDGDRIGFLRDLLFASPLDVVAMRYLANEEEMGEDMITATHVLERAIALSPAYLAARADYAKLLMAHRDHVGAMKQGDYLLANEPNNIRHRLLRADAAMHMERFDEAVALFESIVQQEPRNPHLWNSYGSVLKTVGRREDSVQAYRSLLALSPSSGNAYFGLSELKANYLTDDDVAAMRAHLAKGIPDIGSRKCMAYALGQTLERRRDYQGSFEAYAYGARACKDEIAHTKQIHEPDKFDERLGRMRAVFTAEAMAARAAPQDAPSPATTPIFIIGMPRAGSTLVEQILASHSLVEGTRELPVVSALAKKIALSRALVVPDVYPQRVLEYDQAQRTALGEECLRGIAEYRKTTLPFVIDKRPWNWLDAAFIHLILPQAKFIDIRRAPMAAGFAMFKQLLPADAAFTFDLRHLGQYYRSYVDFMTYLDTVMPGAILLVSYERLVDDTETEIRRMLDYCGLPFEAGCLRFWESDRAVMTPSAEQVRRPIFRDALEQWKNYEPWLGPLRESLGDLAAG